VGAVFGALSVLAAAFVISERRGEREGAELAELEVAPTG
jgi:hypothetical protein